MYHSILKTVFVSFTLSIFVFLALVSTTLAAPMTYTNQASYLAAIGGSADVTVDFNSFVTDTFYQNSTLDIGPFSLSSSGTVHNNLNKIDVDRFSFPGTTDTDGTTHATIYLDSRGSTFTFATLTFDNPINGFGADFGEVDPNTLISFETTSGSGSVNTVTPNPGGASFFGFVLDAGEFLTSFTFTTPVNDGFGIDNVLLSNFESGPVGISEPNSIPLILGALFGIVWLTRRKPLQS